MKTKTCFLIDQNFGEIIAFFPDDYYNMPLHGKDMRSCYSHNGQHSSCHVAYAMKCLQAEPEQYEGLLKELIGAGYDPEIITKKEIS